MTASNPYLYYPEISKMMNLQVSIHCLAAAKSGPPGVSA